MFVGDYFTLMTTVVLDEKLRQDGESDEDFAVRVASVFINEYYGFDVASVSNDIGIVDGEEDDND
ncbi:MAG: hypothetical protein EBT95_00355 [Verrucomicrobia bacterium]|jgi:hypothetical protein|nr:hypothetical protein [Verrucomicrobiota bacterium]